MSTASIVTSVSTGNLSSSYNSNINNSNNPPSSAASSPGPLFSSSTTNKETGNTSNTATLSGIFSLYIINKAGGLIYQKDFNAAIPKLVGNDYLRLASTFHSLHAITGRGINISTSNNINNVTNNGITSLVSTDFRLQCFQSLTLIKFILVSAPNYSSTQLSNILSNIYSLYCDYVLKNPFYELEMPIRVEQFDTKLLALVNK